ncbi:DUF4114 domain-containing protein [Calothrix sp. CCY 0018]|uniref:DUF4114 domain-containing protein n=1 Tax=Calothrix sp. CCY 0018 TaxID=3103864 RepID=UPI0039C7527E
MDEILMPPGVSLAFDSMSIAEDSGKALVYTFKRDGDTTNDLTVNFTVSGDATSEDYDLTGADEGFDGSQGTITIAAKQSEATITITPIADNEIESDETIKLSLEEGADYIINNPEMSDARMDSWTNEDAMKMNVIGNDDVMLKAPWAEKFNAADNGYEFLAVDAEGNTYATGDFTGEVILGNDTLTSAGGSDVFVAKFDTDGKIDWAKNFGNENNDYVEDIAVNSDGEVYFTGTFENITPSEDPSLPGAESDDIFVTKLAANSDELWSKTFGGTSNDEASGIEVDADGNSYITGGFSGQVTFGSTPALDGGQSDDVFVAKLDSKGDVLWAKDFGADLELDQAEDVVVDKEGNAYLFMTENLESGAENVSVVKLNKDDGSETWKKTFGDTTNYVVAEDIAIDNTGNTYIAGEFRESLTFGNAAPIEGGENGDVFVTKLDSKGDVVWAKDFDSENKSNVEVEAIAVDDMGNSYVTGYYKSESMSIGNFMLYDQGGESSEGEDAFIAKFDSEGKVKWAQNIGGMNGETVSDIAVNDGKIYIAGEFYQEATFGDKTLKTDNSRDTFLVKLEEGEFQKEKPEVSLSVDSNTITEGSSSNQVTYTFTRTGEVTAALTVEFTVTGTAKFKEDYSLTGADEGFDGSKGKITFKTGEKTAKVTLDISDDSDTEENETIALSLVETSEYMVSKMDIAMGTITINSDDIETIVDEKPDVSIGDDNDNDSDDDQVDFSLISKTKQTFKFKSKFKNGKSSIKFSFKSKSVKEFQEIGFFTVDDEEGTIDGISPDDEKYAEVALKRSQSIFSLLGNTPQGFSDTDIEKVLEFSSDTTFRFLSVKNGSLKDVKKGKVKLSQVTFSSTDFLEVSEFEKNDFDLDFAGVKIKMKFDAKAKKTIGNGLQDEIAVLDLRSEELSGKQKVKFTVNREAAYENLVGFFQVTDEDGGIDTDGDGTADILVGDAGYAQAAVQNRITSIDLSVKNQSTASFEGEFDAGSIFVPFLIVDGTVENFNEVFFPFLGANSDGVDHVMMLGDNLFGFEDLTGGGDRDFNDIIVKVDFSVNT